MFNPCEWFVLLSVTFVRLRTDIKSCQKFHILRPYALEMHKLDHNLTITHNEDNSKLYCCLN